MGYYKNEITALLEERGIPYRMMEHEAVFTMEEMDACGISREGRVCKNLFLRNAKGKIHYLVSLPEEKQADLKALGAMLDGQRLSFASEERLQKYLGVTHGAVSPLGVLNDSSNSVIAVLDEEILSWDSVGVHPNDNTATIWLAPSDLEGLLRGSGNPLRILKI